jgi:aminomethyltransferase
VGIFDITHMGEIFVEGPAAGAWLDGLVTNKLAETQPGKVVYTPICRTDGGVLDDMLIYRLAPQRWLVVCNASNHGKIFTWLQARCLPEGVSLTDASFTTSLIAVQGPEALTLLARSTRLADLFPVVAELGFYQALSRPAGSGEWIVSRTGYTGERGYEIYLPNADALPLWEELVAVGADLGVQAIGLAARDTLRFEMGYCLYGHELAEDISPLEAGIGWAVKLKKAAFIGKEALQQQKAAGVARRLVGLEVAGRTIARQGTPISRDGLVVGRVTSGNFSPTLKKSLALALVDATVPEDGWQVAVRNKTYPCKVVNIPFLAARVKGDPHAERKIPG